MRKESSVCGASLPCLRGSVLWISLLPSAARTPPDARTGFLRSASDRPAPQRLHKISLKVRYSPQVCVRFPPCGARGAAKPPIISVVCSTFILRAEKLLDPRVRVIPTKPLPLRQILHPQSVAVWMLQPRRRCGGGGGGGDEVTVSVCCEDELRCAASISAVSARTPSDAVQVEYVRRLTTTAPVCEERGGGERKRREDGGSHADALRTHGSSQNSL